MDLIAGLPHQTRECWDDSLERIDCAAAGACFDLLDGDRRGQPAGKGIDQGGARYGARGFPSDDAMAASTSGLRTAWRRRDTSITKFRIGALPGFRSRHNLKYWRREPYLGLGAGAHSFDGRRRWANVHDAAAYVAAIDLGQLPAEQRNRP